MTEEKTTVVVDGEEVSLESAAAFGKMLAERQKKPEVANPCEKTPLVIFEAYVHGMSGGTLH